MKKMVMPAALCAFLLTNAVPAIAHHAFSSEFDAAQPVILKGDFIEMDWVNPHSWVHFEVTFPDGRKGMWASQVRIVARNGETLDEPIRVLDMFGGNPEGIPEGLLPFED